MHRTTWPPPLKPPYGAAVDWSHPLARGLIADFLFNDLTNKHYLSAVSPLVVGDSGFYIWTVRAMTLRGPGVVFDGSNTDPIFLTPETAFNTPQLSIEVWWDGAGTQTAYCGPFSSRTTVASQYGCQIFTDLGDTTKHRSHLTLTQANSELGINYQGTTQLTYPFGRQVSFLWTYDGAAPKFYLDGRDDGAISGGGGGWSGPAAVNIGRGYQHINGTVSRVSIRNVALTAGEAARLYAEPYSFYRPIVRRRYFLAPAGPAAYTLALDAAMLTLTGQAVATRTARLLSAQHASLAMTGQVAALRAERQLAMDAAALTLTGQAAALQAERTLPLDAAQLTLTGQAAALQAERQLPLDAANLTLTGQAAELQHGYTLGLDPAQLTLTGQAMTLQRTAQLLLDRGLLAVRGQAVTLRKSGVGAGQMMRRHHHDRG